MMNSFLTKTNIDPRDNRESRVISSILVFPPGPPPRLISLWRGFKKVLQMSFRSALAFQLSESSTGRCPVVMAGL